MAVADLPEQLGQPLVVAEAGVPAQELAQSAVHQYLGVGLCDRDSRPPGLLPRVDGL